MLIISGGDHCYLHCVLHHDPLCCTMLLPSLLPTSKETNKVLVLLLNQHHLVNASGKEEMLSRMEHSPFKVG